MREPLPLKPMHAKDEIVICLKNVSKYYPIYKNPKDRLKELILRKEYHKKFWALKDINLNVKKGETLGIIGENGAGKSTLLKIISRTLTPSSGEVIIKGRVSPILELGMCFHPEMTGRENIYLSATLLGLSPQEIEENIEAIIAFSELGDFIDQPVKTYSSGMYVRLAFSIATSVNPDILVIDEALSVGDAYFQKKSLNKILEFKDKGKTIVFCSHNTYHITHVCTRAVWMEHGRIMKDGNVFAVVAEYEEKCRKKERQGKKENPINIQTPYVRLKALQMNKTLFKKGEPLILTYIFDNPKKMPFHLAFAITREDGVLCCGTSTYHDNMPPFHKEKREIKLIINKQPLLHGNYQIVGAIIDETATLTYDAQWINFKVEKTEEEIGLFYMEHVWETLGDEQSMFGVNHEWTTK